MSTTTRYWHYVAYACVADELNRACRCAGQPCRACQRRSLAVDAVSIENDLEAAEESRERIRQGVAW